MMISRLLLGALALAALAAPALAEHSRDGEPAAPHENATPAEAASTTPATSPAPAAQPAARPRHTVALGPEGTDEQGRVGRIHTVVRGDTLWDISEAYLGTPWIWPTIWKQNPKVANPHRIYPGNRIWISQGEMRQLTDAEAASLTIGEQPPAATDDASAQPTRIQPVPDMEQIGFVSAEEMETAGALIGSPEQERWLAANRRAWVSLGEGQVEEGDRFLIVREEERVRDPETNKVIGVHVAKLGWLEVTKVGAEASDAMIRQAYAEILRGDRLIPRVEPALEVPVHPGVAKVEGQIAMNPEERKITGHYDIVYLNRGTDHGLEIGDHVEVYRAGPVARDKETKTKHRMPDEVVANLVVITAQPASAVAFVTHVNRELVRGDTFRTSEHEGTSFATPMAEPLDATQWTARTIEKTPVAPAAQPSPAKAAPAR
jgi:hypothetical protein